MPTPVIITPKSSGRLPRAMKQKLLSEYKTNKKFRIISNNNAIEIASAFVSERVHKNRLTKANDRLKKDIDTISKNASHVQKMLNLEIADRAEEIKRLNALISNLEYADEKREKENEALKNKLREVHRIVS